MSNPHEPDELGEDLRRLFADDRLAVPHTSGARDAIVAGAQRRRRRRRAASSSAAMAGVLMLVGGVFAIPAPSDAPPPVASSDGIERVPSTQPPGAAPDPESADAPDRRLPEPRTFADPGPGAGNAEPAPRTGPETYAERGEDGTMFSAGPVLGPDGYGRLRLGMTFEEARDAELLADPDADPPEGCEPYALAEGIESVWHVRISEDLGVAVISASGAHTPEGITTGSSRAEVESAYSRLRAESGGYHAVAGEDSHYRFVFDSHHDVQQLFLRGDRLGQCAWD
ncbi:hypothetical protein H0B56_01075 [Haloechinothrix sp. YIM 98757]|uniref:Uncharacterized protein n=1 Tax=Haloechinothrix aidingensis TaxID=2752311 RepID=A0A838A3K7_9PSEU|nr:hypothetical protein [Haloechinothrix aidingensis]MBA0124130.1 hypothetical protein [Haloechinothrix aidingensis]